MATSTWTSNVERDRPITADDDIAIVYWAGVKDGASPCSFSTQNKRPLPTGTTGPIPTQRTRLRAIDWINVYDTDATPGNDQPPKLRHFSLEAHLHLRVRPRVHLTPSTALNALCQVTFTADRRYRFEQRARHDHGPDSDRHRPRHQRSDRQWTRVEQCRIGARSPGRSTSTRTTFAFRLPTRPCRRTTRRSARIGFSVDWTQIERPRQRREPGKLQYRRRVCSGHVPGRARHRGRQRRAAAFYVADPLGSNPLVAGAPNVEPADHEFLALLGPRPGDFHDLVHPHRHRPGGHRAAPRLGAEQRQPDAGDLVRPAQRRRHGDRGSVRRRMPRAARRQPARRLMQHPASLDRGAGHRGPLDCVQLEQGNKTGIGARRHRGPIRLHTPNNWVPARALPTSTASIHAARTSS